MISRGSTYRCRLRPSGSKRLATVRKTNRLVRRLLYLLLGRIITTVISYIDTSLCRIHLVWGWSIYGKKMSPGALNSLHHPSCPSTSRWRKLIKTIGNCHSWQCLIYWNNIDLRAYSFVAGRTSSRNMGPTFTTCQWEWWALAHSALDAYNAKKLFDTLIGKERNKVGPL